MPINLDEISCVILAGGQARRMAGQNKGLIDLHGKPLIQHVLDRLGDTLPIVISANQQRSQYARFGFPVIQDQIQGQLGPLAGIHAAMTQATRKWLLCVPCDVPLLPLDYSTRMAAHGGTHRACYVDDGQQQHATCCLLSCSLVNTVEDHLAAHKLAMLRFLTEIEASAVDYSDQAQAFFNVNRPQDLHAVAAHD